jgi:hypothetical protein
LGASFAIGLSSGTCPAATGRLVPLFSKRFKFYPRHRHRRPSPQTSCGPHNSVRVPYVRTSVRGPKTVGEAQPKLLVSGPPCVHVEAEESWAFAHPRWGEPATISLETTALHIKIQPQNPSTGEKFAESSLTLDSLRYIVRYIETRRRIYVWT